MRRKINVICIALLMMTMTTANLCFADDATEAFSEEMNANVCEDVMPLYDISMDIVPTLSFSGNTANASAKLTVPAGDASKVVFRVVLEKKSGTSYTTVKTWRDKSVTISSTGSARFTGSYAVSDSGTYRIKVSGTVYKGTSKVGSFSNIPSTSVVC